MDIETREIAVGSDLHRQAQELREQVLRRPLDRMLTPEERARDPEGRHFVAAADGQVVACTILFPQGDGAVRLRQMAVAPAFQGRGVGARLLAFAEERARASGVRSIRLHARSTAIGFYERAGYTEEGAPFDEDGVPHVLMAKTL